MIPFTYSKKIEFVVTDNVEDSTANAVGAIVNRIKAEKPSSLTQNQHRVLFSGGVFRSVPNIRWNILSPIHHGIIDIIRDKDKLVISYELWYTELLIIASAVAGLFFMIMLFSGGTIQDLWIPIFVWTVSYLGNYVISIVRFDVFIHSALNKLDNIIYNQYGNT